MAKRRRARARVGEFEVLSFKPTTCTKRTLVVKRQWMDFVTQLESAGYLVCVSRRTGTMNFIGRCPVYNHEYATDGYYDWHWISGAWVKTSKALFRDRKKHGSTKEK